MGQSQQRDQQIHILSQYNLSKSLQVPNTRRTALGPIELIKFDKYKAQVKLKDIDEHYYLSTGQEIQDPKQFTGYAQLENKEKIRIFEGEFVSGVRCGYGIEFNLQGNILYEGFFQNNLYHGWGSSLGYIGQFNNGMREGWGTYHEQTKGTSLFYEGYWRNNKFHGIGSLNVQTKEIKSFLKDRMKNLSETQVKYVGQWQDGVIEGVGKLKMQNQAYDGEFFNGTYQGKGKIYRTGVRRVKGIFKNGVLLE